MHRRGNQKQISLQFRIDDLGVFDLDRPLGQHIDNEELNALVPTRSETGHELQGLSPDLVREAQLHVDSCIDCSTKLWKYSLLVNRLSIGASEIVPASVDCPTGIDWHDVAAGLWPELKAMQLMKHAALCAHCGPLLHAAARLEYDPTPQEEMLLSELRAPARPFVGPQITSTPRRWQFAKCLVPAAAFMLIVVLLSNRSLFSSRPLSGLDFARFAVQTHRQHTQGSLALDIRSDSEQVLNNWFQSKSPFSLALPARPAAPGEHRPFRLEGARMVQVRGKPAAFISYQVQTSPEHVVPASLTVIPDSVVEASGGIEVNFNNLGFHYATVEGYKVVTWSLHGRTYALVSQEGNGTQRSCMVCHSAMGDRDLGQTPTPLRSQRNPFEPALRRLPNRSSVGILDFHLNRSPTSLLLLMHSP